MFVAEKSTNEDNDNYSADFLAVIVLEMKRKISIYQQIGR